MLELAPLHATRSLIPGAKAPHREKKDCKREEKDYKREEKDYKREKKDYKREE